AVFDRFINVRIPGAQVNRGLADPEDLDDLYEDEGPEDGMETAPAPGDSPGSLV
ncbi:MAG: hypothetical protein GX540_02035, partial [Clostridiales bacterium]|nr:hypothetical protein [Clostridiales bacterium]